MSRVPSIKKLSTAALFAMSMSCAGGNDAATENKTPNNNPSETQPDPEFRGVDEIGGNLATVSSSSCTWTATGAFKLDLTSAVSVILSVRTDGTLLVNDNVCISGTGTVANPVVRTVGTNTKNVTSITVVGAASSAQSIVMDFIGGTYLPGTSTGPVISFNLGDDVGDEVRFRMTSGVDVVNCGKHVTHGSVCNLAADTLPDLKFTGVKKVGFSLGAGADTFKADLTSAAAALVGVGTVSGFDIPVEVYGGDGADTLQGGIMADSIYGDAGDDLFLGERDDNTGNDAYVGGAGTADHLSYAERTSNLTVTIGGTGGEGSEADTIASTIEKITGGTGDDTITGAAGDETLNGGSGNDTLDGKAGIDTLNGNDGNDTFVESTGGATGADVFAGGLGTDTITYASKTLATCIYLNGMAKSGVKGAGDCTSTGADETDTIGTDIENVIGGTVADYIVGSASDNQIKGGNGADTMFGGAGDDYFDEKATGNGNDVIDGEAGIDTVDFSSRTVGVVITLNDTADDGEDTDADGDADETDNIKTTVEKITGTPQADTLDASGADVTVAGVTTGPNNWLSGGLGADTLTGGYGDDVLDGDGGLDVVDCGEGSDIIYTGGNSEVLTNAACEIVF